MVALARRSVRSITTRGPGQDGQGLAEYALAAGVLAGLGFAVLAMFQQWIEVLERALLHAVNG